MRADAGSNLQGSPARGYSARWSQQRAQEINEQKRIVAARQAAQREVESQGQAVAAMDAETRQLESRLSYLKRTKASVQHHSHEPTFG